MEQKKNILFSLVACVLLFYFSFFISSVWFSVTLGILILLQIFALIHELKMQRAIKELTSMAWDLAEGDLTRRFRLENKSLPKELIKSIDTMAKGLETSFRDQASRLLKLKTVLRSMGEGVLVINSDKEILLINPALQKMFDLSPRCIGMTILETIRHSDVQSLLSKIISTGLSQEEEVLLKRGNQMRSFLIHGVPLGGGEGAVCVFHDLTEMRRLETIRKDFVANVSHELKTPLTSIRGYAETIRYSDFSSTEDIVRFAEKIEKNAIDLQDLVEDILSLSRIETGKIEFNIEKIDLPQLLREVQGNLKNKALNKSVEVSLVLADSIQLVPSDKRALLQIFSNLLDNAIKYTPAGGKVTLETSTQGDKWQVAVIDTGLGISQQDLPRIFERFFRGDKAHSKQVEGTGLGLAIVKHLVSTLKGEIHVESKLNQGSTFTVSFPLLS